MSKAIEPNPHALREEINLDLGQAVPAEYAANYIVNKFRPFPMQAGTKLPLHKGYQAFTCEPSETSNLFPPNGNIALLLGPSALVDIDIDSDLLLDLAPFFLPSTDCIFGRDSRPASHWIYCVVNSSELKTQKFCAPGIHGEVLVEYRAGKNSTRVPPSTHGVHEQIRFEPGKGLFPTACGSDELLRAVKEFAFAWYVVKAWPTTAGKRQMLALALAGALRTHGISEALVHKILLRASAAAGDEEAQMRADVVATTSEKIKSGAEVTGWPTVKDLLGAAGEELLDQATEWLGATFHVGETSSLPRRQSLITVRAADVEPEQVEWVWPGYFIRAAINLIDGDPGTGKTTLALDIAARHSAGIPMPGTHIGNSGNVLILSAEDSLQNTIIPRLDAAGADRHRIKLITGVGDREEPQPFFLPEGIGALEAEICKDNVTLVVIDPLFSVLSGKINPNIDQQVRQALEPLRRVAEKTGCTFILIRHLNKQTKRQSLYRGGGSIGITAVARSAMILGKHPDDPKLRVLASVKLNVAERPPSWILEINEETIQSDNGVEVSTSRVHWLEQSDLDSEALVDQAKPKPMNKLQTAIKFLKTTLTGSPLPVNTVRERAEEAGIRKGTLERAANEMGLEKQKVQVGSGSHWEWSMPHQDAQSQPSDADVRTEGTNIV